MDEGIVMQCVFYLCIPIMNKEELIWRNLNQLKFYGCRE